ncbi:MAG: DUF58 domain-containing protein [Candidatus Marinimicrobia bacterium]|nr:DUF58 domain-containing protein [Candidatus Neomarinimicrobiota bacterium]
MLPQELLKKVKLLELKTRNLVNDVFSGEYHSIFKGVGIEFSEVREYQYGDDIRTIDWNVTARYNKPFVKIFNEERELNVVLAIDLSASQYFGTIKKFKHEIATEICALLAFSAIKNNDKVGLLIFTDTIEKFIPPKKGKSNGLRVLREILYFNPESKATNISSAIEYLIRILKRKSIIFIISDFLDDGFIHSMKILNKKHDVIAIKLKDHREKELIPMGLMRIYDPETGEEVWIDLSNRKKIQTYKDYIEQREQEFIKEAKKMKLDLIEIDTGKSYIEPLVRFFKLRELKYKR